MNCGSIGRILKQNRSRQWKNQVHLLPRINRLNNHLDSGKGALGLVWNFVCILHVTNGYYYWGCLYCCDSEIKKGQQGKTTNESVKGCSVSSQQVKEGIQYSHTKLALSN
jgi:hypothetical protein